MFDVTYLGHQGWLIEAGGTRLLIDPVLQDRLTGQPGERLGMYPPRRIDLTKLPPIDGILCSHEHPDHLNLPTLLRLDRRARVLLSGTTSTAAYAILGELGYRTTALRSGAVVELGALELHPFHSVELTRDEWDVTPFLVRDRDGDGSLASSVDAPESAAFARFAAGRVPRIGLWSTSHNHMDTSPLRDGGGRRSDEEVTAQLARDIQQRFERDFKGRPRPEVLAVLASGFSLDGDLAWLNRHLWPAAPRRIVERVGPALAGTAVRAPLPGHRFSMKGGRLVEETGERPFLCTPDPSTWPPHACEPLLGAAPDYPPACGRTALPGADRRALLDELGRFAASLHGGELMRSIYVTGAERAPFEGREACLALRTSAGTLVLAYRPQACAFEEVECAEPRAVFAAGLECWAPDLLAVLRLELMAGHLLLGRSRTWNRAPAWLRFDLDGQLVSYTHPLRAPARALERYRAEVRALREAAEPPAP